MTVNREGWTSHIEREKALQHKAAMRSWFDVDKEGLAKIVRRKGLSFIVYELVQNVLDTGAKRAEVRLEPVDGLPKVWVTVSDDDPDGFKSLEHAYTLFAESEKKSDPDKRGRFNLGEKLVLACCEEAEIVSTRGKVCFNKDGRATSNMRVSCSDQGTTFRGLIRMTRAELDEVRQAAKLIIPPAECEVFLDGEKLPGRVPVGSFAATLPTEVADEEGYLKRTARKTTVRVFQSQGTSRLYEMGIPVVEIDLPWDVEVWQKIPLNADRDNVTPAYARELAVAVVNEMHKFLKPEDAVLPGVQEALADNRIEVEAVNTILTHQHGEKRVVLDPRDPEANAKAFQKGFTVIRGSAYTKDQWENIRRAKTTPASTILFPTPEIYSSSPDASVAKTIPEEEWTPGMRNIASYATELAWRIIHKGITVRFETRFGAMDYANYGSGDRLCFNVSRLGYKWFEQGPSVQVNDLLIHELSHESGAGHLTEQFDDALSLHGAKMVALALTEPEFFRKYQVK
jgi:hypothetical protein